MSVGCLEKESVMKWRRNGEGMAKEWAKPFYNSTAWKEARAAYIKLRITIDGGLCETCGKKHGYIVHHKIPLTEENICDPEITLNFENFKYDCKECHDNEDENHGVNRKKECYCEFINGIPIPKGKRDDERTPL